MNGIRITGTLRQFFVLGVAASLSLIGCGSSPAPQPPATASTTPAMSTSPAAPVPAASQPDPAHQGSERFNQLLKAWETAGIKTTLRQALRSNTINSMFGCTRHYEVFLNDRLVIVMEYDPANPNRTAKRNLEYVEANGRQSQNNEPAWKSAEFVLVNSASIIDNGEIKQKFKLTEHPDLEKILAAFKEYK